MAAHVDCTPPCPPDPSAWLRRLLDDNDARRWHVEYKKFLSSHLLCGAVGLERLGADEARVRRWVEGYAKEKLEAARAHREEEHQQLQPRAGAGSAASPGAEDAVISALRGQRKEYYRILHWFQQRFRGTHGGRLGGFLKAEFPPLSDGVAACLLHCIINLGYAAACGSEVGVVEAMAYLHHSYRPLVGAAGVAAAAEGFGRGPLTFLDALRALREDRAAWVATQSAAEGRMRDPAAGWFSSTPQYRIAAMLEHGDALYALADSLAAPQAVLASKARGVALGQWLLDAALEAFALCENRYEFVLLHGVTSTWALCRVLPYLTDDDAVRAVRAMTCVVFAAYAAQGCPELSRAVAPATLNDDAAWGEVAAAALERDADEHLYKIVAIAKEMWHGTAAGSRRARICEMAARNAMENEIYWHKYAAPEGGIEAGALGVRGVRDDTK